MTSPPRSPSPFFPPGALAPVWAVLLLVLSLQPVPASGALGDSSAFTFPRTVHRMLERNPGLSGAYILQEGDEALQARAWMVHNAEESIDILTFIWRLDSIGLIATAALLEAADRGVHVRIVVDDLLLHDEPLGVLLALDAHPRIEIRVYNPVRSVGVSTFGMIRNLLADFRRFNQRLHNKTFLADGIVGICGGRNVADEYFDYARGYTFRDRDILVVGPVVAQMRENFETFWQSRLSIPIGTLLPRRAAALTEADIGRIYRELADCVHILLERLPLVRDVMTRQEEQLQAIMDQMVWAERFWFVSDAPEKNLGKPGLGGGGAMQEALREAVLSAQERITLQSPYMVVREGELGLFRKCAEGVEVRISTNSLASTDNIAAFSGYVRGRDALLRAGMTVREFRPDPQIERAAIERYLPPGAPPPIIVLHAKTLVVDGELVYVGTYNIDPRSAHLNTEEGVFVRSRELARRVEEQIEREMAEGNSWDPGKINPNLHASTWRRIKLWFFMIWPIRALL